MTGDVSAAAWVVVVSELAALWIIWRLWRSGDHLFFKISLSAVALLPVIGPILALWMGNFPTKQPQVFQDRRRYAPDVLERWRHVFEEKNPVRRFRRWREMVATRRDEEP
jgi:hypothetical protein